MLQLHRHGLDRNYRVIHQQAERDDHRAQRDALQIDAEQLHADEHAGQNHRNADCDHDAGAPAEAEEAHQQYDREGFEERFLEVADIPGHDFGLVVHAHHVHAERQSRRNLRTPRSLCAAEVEDVPAIGHGDREPERRLAVDLHGGNRRVHGAAPDGDEVAQRHEMAMHLNRQGCECRRRIQCARGANIDAVVRRIDEAARDHAVLALHGGEYVLRRQPEPGQLVVGEIEIDPLVLRADQVDLANPGHREKLLANVLGDVLELRQCEAIAGDGVNDAVHVAEFVVEERALHARGKRLLDIADLLAHLIPEIRHLARRRAAWTQMVVATPLKRSCDDEAQAAFGSVWSGAIVLTRSSDGGRTRSAATVLGGGRDRHGE